MNKKKQKNFVHADGKAGPKWMKVFLLLFLQKKKILAYFALAIAATIIARASAASPHPSTFTHLPGSRSL